MAFSFNGNTPRKIIFNNQDVKKLIYNNDVVWEKKRLPAEYQEVEYIESTGTQYIDTNLLYAANDRIEVDVAPVTITLDRVVFGSYISSAYVELGILTSKFRFDISDRATTPITENVRYKVVKDGATWTVDGNTITTSGSNKNTPYPIYLFGRCFNGTAQKMSNIKVYSYRHIRNSVTIADFVPCYRKIDNVAGMYDVVNDVFYTNDGTGEFNVGADIITVPSEYQKVEYIQSSGTQYIRTSVSPSDDFRMDLKVYSTCVDSFYCAGLRVGSNIIFGQTGPTANNRVSASVNGSSVTASTDGVSWSRDSAGQTYEIMLRTNGDGTFTYHIKDLTNGKEYLAENQSYSLMGNVTYGICMSSLNSVYILNGTNQFYYFRLYKNGEIAFDGIPCYRKSDDEIGLYDITNDIFYTNSGTGTFTKGPDVN